jgi:hypothetical protein
MCFLQIAQHISQSHDVGDDKLLADAQSPCNLIHISSLAAIVARMLAWNVGGWSTH